MTRPRTTVARLRTLQARLQRLDTQIARHLAATPHGEGGRATCATCQSLRAAWDLAVADFEANGSIVRPFRATVAAGLRARAV